MSAQDIIVRPTYQGDFGAVTELCRRVYPTAPPWTEVQLSSHLRVFPDGQFVAVEQSSGRIVGMAASLIVRWDDYDLTTSWREFTDAGAFTNHDPSGKTLYGAEVMVDPERQRLGIGAKLYAARRALVERMDLLRIRAGARLRGYHRFADAMPPNEYVARVVSGRIVGPTLSFQLREGFRVIAVVPDYLRHDPESLGYAAVIEWLRHADAPTARTAPSVPPLVRPRPAA